MKFFPTTRRQTLPIAESDPLSTLSRVRSEMDRLFDRFVESPWSASFGKWVPSIDIAETDNELTICAEVPGISADEVKVTISDNVLTISGEKNEETEEKGEGFYHSERRFGSFSRSIELPPTVNKDKIAAEQTNGVLTVHVPKLPSAKSRQVEIKQAANAKQQTERIPVGAR